jgi:hypothetical protein
MLSRYVIVNRVPVPRRLAKTIRLLLRESGATLESCYRGRDAERLLHRYGHSSQRELYDGWRRHLPGFNPANPPGFSTHELRSDGSAYPHVPRGGKLSWWQVGLDIDDLHVDRFIAAGRRHGVSIWRPYPGGSEHHHVNLHRPPPRRLWGVR